jgi:hypothetical protein
MNWQLDFLKPFINWMISRMTAPPKIFLTRLPAALLSHCLCKLVAGRLNFIWKWVFARSPRTDGTPACGRLSAAVSIHLLGLSTRPCHMLNCLDSGGLRLSFFLSLGVQPAGLWQLGEYKYCGQFENERWQVSCPCQARLCNKHVLTNATPRARKPVKQFKQSISCLREPNLQHFPPPSRGRIFSHM